LSDILFVDDEKKPEWYGLDPSTMHIATSFREALSLINKNSYSIIYLDHDLGSIHVDGSILLQKYMMLKKELPLKKVYCISWNPIGIERIRLICKDFNVPFELFHIKKEFEIINGQSG
jgi:hypothetical protein